MRGFIFQRYYHYILFCTICLLFCTAEACAVPKSKDKPAEYNRYKVYYETAVQLYDTANQISALVGMLSIKHNDTFVLRVLSNLYLTTGHYASSLACAARYLQADPDNIAVIKTQGTALQAARDFQGALIAYTELFYRTREPQFKYLQAMMEYELFRQVEALKTIEDCMNIPTSEAVLIQMKYGDGTSQWIPIKVACINLKGQVYMDMKNFEMARLSFEEALKRNPDFLMAKKNLEGLSSLH